MRPLSLACLAVMIRVSNGTLAFCRPVRFAADYSGVMVNRCGTPRWNCSLWTDTKRTRFREKPVYWDSTSQSIKS
jgi:hypothetical protein